MTITMSTSAQQYRRHRAENHKVGFNCNPATRNAFVPAAPAGLEQRRAPKQALGSRQNMSGSETNCSSSNPPPTKVYSTVNPIWGSKGNGCDPLLPDPPSLGVKQSRGLRDRMFLDNFTYGKGILSLSALAPATPSRSVRKMWEVCLPGKKKKKNLLDV